MTEIEKKCLLKWARRSIQKSLKNQETDEKDFAALLEECGCGARELFSTPSAVFVTLELEGELRGCIGSLEARRPLWQDVRDNALAAAFSDPRFPPLSPAEEKKINLEISLLSKPVPLEFRDSEDLLEKLRPGIDGVVFQCKGRRSTFLPQVWEQLPEKAQFLEALTRKAGLPAGDWKSPEARFEVYQADHWHE